MNDLELLDRHIDELQHRLDALEARVQIAADEHQRRQAAVIVLEARREALPHELSTARGAAEAGTLKTAEIARLLDEARASANEHRQRAYALEGEASDIDDRLAKARQGLEAVDHSAVRDRDKLAAELAAVVKRRGELKAEQDQAEDARLRAIVDNVLEG